jgi:hypothetical protein
MSTVSYSYIGGSRRVVSSGKFTRCPCQVKGHRGPYCYNGVPRRDSHGIQTTHPLTRLPILARILYKMKSEEAEHSWRALIEMNPDCYEYYRGFLNSKGIDLGMLDPKARSVIYDGNASRFRCG